MPRFVLTPLDLAIMGGYIVAIIGFGLWISRRISGSADYFLAGRRLPWWMIGLSLFATNISTSSFIGMSGEAYGGVGVAVYNYEWMAAVVLVLFAAFFLPFYLRSGIYTMPEFLARRFDGRSRSYFSVMTIVLNVVVDTAGSLYAGALLVRLLFPDVPLWAGVVVLAGMAGFYTMAGGLMADVYNDTVQAVVLLFGSLFVAYASFNAVGSWADAVAASPPERLSLILPPSDPNLPWPGLLTGVFVVGFYFWATNQFMVQRVLAANSLRQGRWGALFAGALKLPVLFLMVLPGTFARVLYPDLERADLAYPTMIFDLLPPGARGIVLTAMAAALMSSVDSTLNSASTLVTMDFVRRWRPDIEGRRLVTVGRVTTFTFMVFAAVWTPFILQFDTLWQYLQSVLSYVVPPVVALFVVGLFWKRATGTGAFWALVAGHVVSAVLFVLGPVRGVLTIQFLYVPAILLAVSVAVLVAVSLATPPPTAAQTDGYTWTPALFRAENAELAALPWYQNYRVQSVVLLILTALFVGLFW